MYVQGVSTRKVSQITEQLCGCEISSSDVSRATALLDEELQKWRNRPLGCVKYLILDARYEKVREAGCVRDCALLTAIGVDDQGRRSILGVSVSLSEAEVHWREFLKSLLARGLHGLELIVSDAHAGLKEARQACLGSVPWQRCQFHLLHNALAHVPKEELKREVIADVQGVLNAPICRPPKSVWRVSSVSTRRRRPNSPSGSKPTCPRVSRSCGCHLAIAAVSAPLTCWNGLTAS